MKSNPNADEILKTPTIPGFKDFNLKELVYKYLKYWYWFVLSFIVFTAFAYVSLRYSNPLYDISSTIVISQEDNLSDAGLSVFKDLGLEQPQDQIENEIQILRSKTLIEEVITKLKLNVQYFYEGRVLDIEEYENPMVTIDFLVPDATLFQQTGSFNVRVVSTSSFSFIDGEGEVLGTHNFGETVPTAVGKAVLTPNQMDLSTAIGKVIKIKLIPVRSLVANYRSRLTIARVGQNSSVLQISMRDAVINKAKDFIDNLVDAYSAQTIDNKKATSNKTAQFLDDRLMEITSDLSSVDNKAAAYMSQYGITEDVSGSTGRIADLSTENQREIAIYETQNLLIQSTIDFIKNKEAQNDLIPSNLGIDDSSITTEIGVYNTLVLQRRRLLKTSSIKNPVVVKIEDELEGLREVLFQSLLSLKEKVAIKLQRVQQQEKRFTSKLRQAPERQKNLREIARDQGVTEQLYLYLLQKKEEADITSHITVPNSRIIDRASLTSFSPVAPNKKSTYLLSTVLSLLLPFIFIYVRALLDTTVKSKGDLEDLVSAPIIGTIPKGKSKTQFAIDRQSRSPISEAFRILRTNINFLLAGVEKDTARIIFTTSSVSGEGKTFISSNIAKTLAVSGHKVAYIGTDFRFPKFHEVIDLPNGSQTSGFTNYIMNTDIPIKDVIYKQQGEDAFDVIPPGTIPPNPSGLLMNDRVKTMFDYLEEHYDFVVVDTAPVSLVTDTLLISRLADLTIYVVKENFSDKRLLSIPEKYYQDGRLVNMAVLLNYASTNMGGAYGYGYGYNVKK